MPVGRVAGGLSVTTAAMRIAPEQNGAFSWQVLQHFLDRKTSLVDARALSNEKARYPNNVEGECSGAASSAAEGLFQLSSKALTNRSFECSM
jgi:hypothetical protein